MSDSPYEIVDGSIGCCVQSYQTRMQVLASFIQPNQQEKYSKEILIYDFAKALIKIMFEIKKK